MRVALMRVLPAITALLVALELLGTGVPSAFWQGTQGDIFGWATVAFLALAAVWPRVVWFRIFAAGAAVFTYTGRAAAFWELGVWGGVWPRIGFAVYIVAAEMSVVRVLAGGEPALAVEATRATVRTNPCPVDSRSSDGARRSLVSSSPSA